MRRLAPMMLMIAVIAAVLAACGGDNMAAAPEERAETPQSEVAATATDATTTEGVQVPKQWNTPPEMQLEEGKDYQAVLHTNKGDLTIDLLESEAPKTVNNFVFLANQDFYQNVPFHRVIKGFMVQTGDPTGTGAGGPGYRFEDEPVTRNYQRGTVAMANAGPNTNGSQFFIVHQDTPQLPKNYTIFGQVTEGLDVLDAIANVPVGPSRMGETSSPTEPVTLEGVEIKAE